MILFGDSCQLPIEKCVHQITNESKQRSAYVKSEKNVAQIAELFFLSKISHHSHTREISMFMISSNFSHFFTLHHAINCNLARNCIISLLSFYSFRKLVLTDDKAESERLMQFGVKCCATFFFARVICDNFHANLLSLSSSGRRLAADSLRMIYYNDQTIAIVELGPEKLLLSCELIEI